MTRSDIIRMARDAGIIEEFHGVFPSMERFAALVAAAEREACAKVCEELFQQTPPYTSYAEAAQDCADAIRARRNHD